MNRSLQLTTRSIALSLTIAATGAALTLSGCGREAAGKQAAPPPPAVSVAQVLAREVTLWEEFTGRVEAVESVQVRPRVDGYIREVRFDEGHLVGKGDVLFVIDQRPYRAALARAEAELARARAEAELARTEVARARKLVESRAISREEFDRRLASDAQVKAQVQAAQAAVDMARLNLEFTEVRSPIAGRAGRALVTEGNLVNAGATPLVSVVSLDPVYVYFEADEQTFLRSDDLARRDGDTPVRIRLAHEEGFPHGGTLDFVDNRVNPDTGTIRGRAVVPNRDGDFTPGLFARVRVRDSTPRRAMLVDEKAILTDQDRSYVYVLGPENRALRRDVELGRRVEGLRIITAGLSGEDRVVVHGVQKIFFPGMPVQPQTIAMGDPPPQPPALQAASGAGPEAQEPSP